MGARVGRTVTEGAQAERRERTRMPRRASGMSLAARPIPSRRWVCGAEPAHVTIAHACMW